MNITDKNIKKYPVSINNQQCVGPCYPANKIILHPITLNYLTSKEPFCPTLRWYDEKEHQYKNADICLIPSDSNIDQQQIDTNLVVPTFYFNCEYFLKAYYDIYSFENATEWINVNSDQPYNTQLRVINCAWRVFGPDIDIMNDQLIEFYLNIIKKVWIREIYPKISKYIHIDKKDNNVYISADEPDTQTSDKKYTVEKINYFNQKFNTRQIFYNVLKKYIDENKNNWAKIINHNHKILSTYKKYITEKIRSIINNK